jgi:hypothetical protein
MPTSRAERETGEYIPLVWDGDGTPCAHYVKGHVTDAEFRAAIEAYFGDSAKKPVIPPDAAIEHVYIRSVPSSDSDLEREWRHCAKGRGAAPMTMFTVAPHRGEGM